MISPEQFFIDLWDAVLLLIASSSNQRDHILLKLPVGQSPSAFLLLPASAGENASMPYCGTATPSADDLKRF
jgi:hypothetical protein